MDLLYLQTPQIGGPKKCTTILTRHPLPGSDPKWRLCHALLWRFAITSFVNPKWEN